jgi:hypothetical protein
MTFKKLSCVMQKAVLPVAVFQKLISALQTCCPSRLASWSPRLRRVFARCCSLILIVNLSLLSNLDISRSLAHFALARSGLWQQRHCGDDAEFVEWGVDGDQGGHEEERCRELTLMIPLKNSFSLKLLLYPMKTSKTHI